MGWFKVLAVAFATACLTGAGAVWAGVAEAATADASRLRGSTLYVYNFLDVREGQFTSKALAEFDAQLAAKLQAEQVASRSLRFKATMIGLGFASTLGAASIPVVDVFTTNKPKEVEAGARHRLIVFPAEFVAVGAKRSYTIRYVLMDAVTDEVVWSGEHKGDHVVIFTEREGAAKRAARFTDFLIEALRNKRLL